ncbi:MAG: LysM peptidoglycan-binding domain-containing protein [Dehalococcoidia bacterium]|nr:LysM peptidoglycan-binding domain-containing protein [Dehalococcoidia bacterium]
MPEPTCHYCNRPAEAECPTCGRLYCGEHGDDVCLRCMAPESATPSALVYRGSVLTLVIASLVALFLVLRPPEKETDNGVVRTMPTSTAAVSATATPTPPVTRTVTATTTAAASPGASPTPGGSPTPAGSPTAAATATPGPRTYVVQSGDTLSSIAAENGTTVDEIVGLNPGLEPNTLQVGAEIRLP